MWTLLPEDEYKRRAKKWPKKYNREFKNVHDNLDTFLKALNTEGVSLEQIPYGFLHDEPKGVKAVDQKGPGQGLTQLRLYLYPHRQTKTVHVITIGNKNTQKKDIEYSKEFVDSLLSTTEDNKDG